MRSRNVVTGMLLGAGSVAGTLLLRRRQARRRDRVDVYFGNGSMVSMTKPDDAAPFVQRARRILELAG